MADISSYPLGSPKLTDLIVGSETYSAAVNPPVYGNPTRNFSISDISALSPQGTVTSIGIAANNGAGTTITVSGSHSFLGTANQINTSVAGTVVTFAFPTDVVVPRDFTVTRQLNVGGESSLTGTLNMNAAKIANLQNPTLAQDAATKAYVDGASGVGGTAGTIPIFDATGLGDSQMTYVNNQFIVNASSKFQTGWIRISAAGATDGYLEVLGSLGTQGQVLTSGASQLAQWTTLDITGTAGALAIYAADGSLSDSLITFTGNMFTVASTAKFKTGWLRLSDAGETTGYLEAKGSLGTLGQVLSSGADNLAEWKTLALDFLPLTGGTVTGQINGITPVAAANLTRKDYVDTAVANAAFLPLAGGTVTGQVNGITPTAAANLTRKDYVDTFLPLAGGIMTGAIVVNDNVDINLGSTPATDARIYFDGDNLEIQNKKPSGDISMRATNPGGSLGEYFTLDGGLDITRFYKGANFNDDVKLTFGDPAIPGDLEIFHNQTNSIIKDTGTGNLVIQGSNVILQSALTKNAVVCNNDDSVDIYHNGTQKFATAATGVKITGGILDVNDQLGTAGQVLSSTGTTLDWIDAAAGGGQVNSLTTTGTGAATLISNVLNIPTPGASAFTSLTTTGTTGAATLASGVLNIPQYAGGAGTVTGVTATLPIVSTGGAAPVISINGMTAATAAAAGLKGAVPGSAAGDQLKFLRADATWQIQNAGTVTDVAALTLGTTGTDLSSTVATGDTTPVITLNVPTASASNRGALSASDWTTFNNKTSTTGTVTLVASTFAGTAFTATVTLSLIHI